MFHGTALCPEVGRQGRTEQDGGGRKGLSCLLPRTHCLKSSGLWLSTCLNLPARDTCGGHSMLESQTRGEGRLLLCPASLRRAPCLQSISPAPPCAPHLCSSSPSSAPRPPVIKGQAVGNRLEAFRLGQLRSLSTLLFLFSQPCSFLAF